MNSTIMCADTLLTPLFVLSVNKFKRRRRQLCLKISTPPFLAFLKTATTTQCWTASDRLLRLLIQKRLLLSQHDTRIVVEAVSPGKAKKLSGVKYKCVFDTCIGLSRDSITRDSE